MPADPPARLEPHRPESEQLRRRAARVLQRERGEPGQHRVAHAVGEGVRPARRPRRVGRDQRVHDRLGRDERKRHHAAEEIVLRLNAQRSRLVDKQRVARHEVEVTAVAR
jgi:hypothetical protein